MSTLWACGITDQSIPMSWEWTGPASQVKDGTQSLNRESSLIRKDSALQAREKSFRHGMEISVAWVKQLCGGAIIHYSWCGLLLDSPFERRAHRRIPLESSCLSISFRMGNTCIPVADSC